MSETIRFLTMAMLFCCALFGAATLLTGCNEAKFVECLARDNTRNPCN